MSIFKLVIYGSISIVVGALLDVIFTFGIIQTLGYVLLMLGAFLFIVPIYVVLRYVKKNGLRLKKWRMSLRKLGYIVVMIFPVFVIWDNTDFDWSSTWWLKLIMVGLILADVYSFIFINSKEEEDSMYDEILG